MPASVFIVIIYCKPTEIFFLMRTKNVSVIIIHR